MLSFSVNYSRVEIVHTDCCCECWECLEPFSCGSPVSDMIYAYMQLLTVRFLHMYALLMFMHILRTDRHTKAIPCNFVSIVH